MADRCDSIDMIYLRNFLHLFGFEKQRVIVARLGRLLAPRASSMDFGRNISAEQGGPFIIGSLRWDM